MRRVFHLALVTSACVALMGCQPTEFGVPQKQFQQMSQQQQQAQIKKYNAEQAAKAKRRTWWHLLGTAVGIAEQNQTVRNDSSATIYKHTSTTPMTCHNNPDGSTDCSGSSSGSSASIGID